MATKAEAQHAEDIRHGMTPKARKRAKATKPRREKLTVAHAAKRAGRKASYAKEVPAKNGKTSRKSTRKSANRAKPDTNLTLRQERRNRSPETRARRAIARRSRVRGSPSA